MLSPPLAFLSSHILWHLSTVTSPISPFKRMHKWAMKIWSFFKQLFWLDKSQQIRLPRMVASCSGGERVGRTGASVGSITFPSHRVRAAGTGRGAATETLLGCRRPSAFAQTASTLLAILQVGAGEQILPRLCSAPACARVALLALGDTVAVYSQHLRVSFQGHGFSRA